MNIEARWLW